MFQSRLALGVVTLALSILCVTVEGTNPSESSETRTSHLGGQQHSLLGAPKLAPINKPVFCLRNSIDWLVRATVAGQATERTRPITITRGGTELSPFAETFEPHFFHWNHQIFQARHRIPVQLRPSGDWSSRSLAGR